MPIIKYWEGTYMKALIVKGKLSEEELIKAAKKEKKTRLSRRLQALSLLKQGWKIRDIATAMLVTVRTVENWINRYNLNGIDGLQDKPKSGAPMKLKNEIEFSKRVDAGVDLKKDKVCVFYGKEFQRILKNEFNAEYSLSGVYLLLHRFGFSSLKPRQSHPKADKSAQEDFKKTLHIR